MSLLHAGDPAPARHHCPLPPHGCGTDIDEGAVWRCDCGQAWHLPRRERTHGHGSVPPGPNFPLGLPAEPCGWQLHWRPVMPWDRTARRILRGRS